MFTSLKTKVILLITIVMAGTAVAIIFSTQRFAGEAILRVEETSTRNILNLVDLQIRIGYNRLIADKIEILSGLQNEMEHISVLGASIVEQLIRLHDAGYLSLEQAQQAALNWLKSTEFDKGDLFAVSRDSVIVGHSDPEFEGMSIAGLRDLKGRPLAQLVRDDTLENEGAAAVFSWNETKGSQRKLGYFVPISRWQWTIGASIDFDDIEAESQKRMRAIVSELGDTFGKIQVAETGYVFCSAGRKMFSSRRPGSSQNGISRINPQRWIGHCSTL